MESRAWRAIRRSYSAGQEILELPGFLVPFAQFALSLVPEEGGAVSQRERLAGLRIQGIAEEECWLWMCFADRVIAARAEELLRRRRSRSDGGKWRRGGRGLCLGCGAFEEDDSIERTRENGLLREEEEYG